MLTQMQVVAYPMAMAAALLVLLSKQNLCRSVLCCAGVYSVGPANQKQILSCAELAHRRHTELMDHLQQQQQEGAEAMEA